MRDLPARLHPYRRTTCENHRRIANKWREWQTHAHRMRKVGAICEKVSSKRTEQWTRWKIVFVLFIIIDSSLPSFQSFWHWQWCRVQSSQQSSRLHDGESTYSLLYYHICIQHRTQRTHINGQQNSIIYYKISHNVADCIETRCEAHSANKLNPCTWNEWKEYQVKVTWNSQWYWMLPFKRANQEKEKTGVKIFLYCLFRISAVSAERCRLRANNKGEFIGYECVRANDKPSAKSHFIVEYSQRCQTDKNGILISHRYFLMSRTAIELHQSDAVPAKRKRRITIEPRKNFL